ncbi:metallophosphoesterase [Hyalangium versicolor]|uniref:metallophosphoesterase n=1 Tax=Hyalangium versicolor TaxID=2861190 RepID=UPI001CCB01B0|nr:metallophosphoesterase [Hyalangium versicolor]
MHFPKVPALGALVAALTLTAGAAQATTLTRSPYLQRVGPNTALVAFRLDSNCAPEVHYGTQGATDQVARSADSGRIHAVELKGLSPGTEYSYEVVACGARTPTRKFHTAPVPGTRHVHFAAVGDFGTGGNDERQMADKMLASHPDLFVALGDNAYASGTESEIQNNLFVPLADVLAEVPFFPVAGNHEYVTDQSQPYLDNLYLPTSPSGGERYYSFDWGHVHFVGLDSNCAIGLASKDRCTLAAQKAWLEQDLATSKAAWKIVYFHHPPWSSGEHGSQPLMRREFGPLFEKYGVDLVLTGHDHNYERSKPMIGDGVAPAGQQGITYLVVGGGGASLRPFAASQPSWSVLRNNSAHGFLDVTVDEGTLTAKLISTTGSVVDSFSLTKKLAPQEPVQDFNITVEGERGTAPLQAYFRATLPSSDFSVRWDFGDGQSGEGAETRHLYAQPGEYTVTATATSGSTSLNKTTQVSVSSQGTVETPTEPVTPTPETPSAPGTSNGLPGSSDSGNAGCASIPAEVLLPLAALTLAEFLRRRRH